MTGVDSALATALARSDRGRVTVAFVSAVAVVAALGVLELYALLPHGRSPRLPETGAGAPTPLVTIGSVESPVPEGIVGPRVSINGWALDPVGIRAIEVRIDGKSLVARTGVERADIAAAHSGFPDAARSGFTFSEDLSSLQAPPGADRRVLAIVAIANDGRATTLATRSLIEPVALARWQWASGSATHGSSRFYLLPALSAIGLGGARDLERWYTPYLSSTTAIGMRVPILYLRTTRGRTHDYEFDPDWDIERRCARGRMAEDSLNGTIAYAIAHNLPVLFTLNGGVWADSGCDVPEWDLNDHLEAAPANCQWNENNEVMADDYLKHLAGSIDAPELARSLTFNVYAADVRRYKRRNLQVAARIVAEFARAHPDLFVGVTLDPDTYLNPFFEGRQWYDYNPGTLKQFRHWLAASGPYSGAPDMPGVPDLSAYRRKNPLTLGDISRLAGRNFGRFADVEPPRSYPRTPTGGRPAFWDDPWTREWEVFRRHLVQLHYDELSRWVSEAGIPESRIWSGQGFMAPAAGAPPFAVRVDSPMKTYDTGGVSIEGSHPKFGHLGAIVYGPSAANAIPMEGRASFFATLRAEDRDWATVEINTADLRKAKAFPTYATAYRSLRDHFNYGAHYVSPMAWNGSDGNDAGKPGYSTFTAWRNTPFEEAARDFLLSHANVPRGSRLWTFGSAQHADTDGWSAEGGRVEVGRGNLALKPVDARLALVSPRELDLRAPLDRLVLGIADSTSLAAIRVLARVSPDAEWLEIAPSAPASRFTATSAGIIVPISLPGNQVFDQLRLELAFADASSANRVDRIALLPSR